MYYVYVTSLLIESTDSVIQTRDCTHLIYSETVSGGFYNSFFFFFLTVM